ncbi:MAG TPA: GvpL/GvpF family gas vesicle protein [Thermoleophilia bacterium]
MSLGIYLFCLTPAEPPPRVEGAGVDGLHPLFSETVGGVAAILSEVDLEEFSGPDARECMENLAWIGPRGLRHEEVIIAAMRTSPVLPVRFGTIFSSLEALVSPLKEHGDIISRFLVETAGRSEWMLKGYVNRQQARSSALAVRLEEEKDQLAGLTLGKRYLLEQKIKGAVDQEVASWLRETAEEVIRPIREASWSYCDGRLVGKDVTGEDEEMFFHGALLVPDGAVEILRRMTGEWNALHGPRGLSFGLSGPWPPYHFAPVLETKS